MKMFMFTCLPDDCYQYYYNEMKAKNTTLSKQFQNPIEKSKRKIKTSNIHMHNDSLSWLSTSTSIKSDRAKLVV